MIASIILAAAAPLPEYLRSPWAVLSREPALERVRTTVEIGTLEYDKSTKQLIYWLHRTVKSYDRNEESWTDSRACPAASRVVLGMRQIKPPRFAPPGSDGSQRMILDGVSYSLMAPSEDGAMVVNGNLGSAAADWIEDSLVQLDKCWGSKIPQRSA